MTLTPFKLNQFLLFKLPAAYLTGVRVQQINPQQCSVTLTHRWINQNPFGSIYFAVLAMAAELSTGALLMYHIQQQTTPISMLVAQNKASFTKKAKGKITFTCTTAQPIQTALTDALHTQQGQTFWLQSIGLNSQGEQVAVFDFLWTIKAK